MLCCWCLAKAAMPSTMSVPVPISKGGEEELASSERGENEQKRPRDILYMEGNLASCAVAVTLAYFLWVKPSQDLKREQQAFMVSSFWVGFRQRQIEKRKPIPDPQDTGLTYARKRETMESDT
ncbi:hypothetical protein CKAN_01746200 [Cinnamomum micranthum f. kanehirae]|uniref:Uncharacterized protein n=1 Tax=Cinnamomum micranthum f. kanehirae TaxID=337451 RepID=A0A3S3MY42_9MAGN|nr:hypothetical protein CKAN_01746200 [Cinnamomum micranthum f. kanehirae]